MTATDQSPARIATAVSKSELKGGTGQGNAGNSETKTKTPKKKILIAAVLLLALGGVAKFTVLAPKAKPAAAASAAKAKPSPGPVIAMTELTLNLANSHFLRLNLSIETTKGTSGTLDVTEATQAVIDEFSNRTVASLTGNAARDNAKRQLLVKLQKLYPKKIQDLYYTEFVMQ